MNFTMLIERTRLVGLALVLLASAHAVRAGEQALSVLNQGTREVKRYEFGATPFRVDVSFVPGWSHCTGRPVKNVLFHGIETKRLELWCNTQRGAGVAMSCVASGSSPSVAIQQLLAEGYKVDSARDSIDARGAVELTLSCSMD